MSSFLAALLLPRSLADWPGFCPGAAQQERIQALQSDAEECGRLRQEAARLRGANEARCDPVSPACTARGPERGRADDDGARQVMKGQLEDREREVANLQVALGQLSAEARGAGVLRAFPISRLWRLVLREASEAKLSRYCIPCAQTEEKERWRGEYSKLRDALARDGPATDFLRLHFH